ncbi:hypothetical protein HBH98_116440 [Parastagonospora nodorum]|nr:hypothetical protein HBI10_161690 [Parastagonospora nodorum]KAH4019534.1 hypothetical protein HBI13_126050 [Parastagonospora nodorum]KAH4019708.1 hypothetical protein HBI09_184650 [Parastagonospora nodorum]KAH4112644.1 hypothetical protein HBH47_223420 [Parastagonospora nodorum]KAH4345833.1 hypothetical protein HBH98_116440 [Parastagonospora nodorum]
MSLDAASLSKLPPAQYVPGRQYTIDHAGRINKEPFVISTSILFGFAILSVLARFAIRIFGGRKIKWDDGFVLISCICLIISFACVHKLLNTFYLVEAMNQKMVIPFRDDIPAILDVPKWAFMFSVFTWTSLYFVKFAFMYFFYPLTLGLSIRTLRLFWVTVGFLVVCWVYAVVNFAVICPHFGANATKCNTNPQQHARSVAGNVVVGVLDIICDVLIVSIPIFVVNESMMPLSRKVSVVALLGLSTFMIICTLIRVVGSVTETTEAGQGTAPVWAMYWFIIEGCVSLIMVSVIVIRGVFISKAVDDDRQKQDSMLQQFGRRLLSILRLSRSSSSRSSSELSDSLHERKDTSAPRIATQKVHGGTMNTVRSFISGGRMQHRTQNDTQLSVDTDYSAEVLDYHNVRKAEVSKHTP